MAETNNHKAPVIIDFGKKKRKAVKQVRKGQGPLMDDIRDAIVELESAGTVAKDVQPLIVIIESTPKRSGWTAWM